ncbi:MAG: alcohol dehydrogenase catalytic domain-containing protein [Actinomycetota bacterium]
MRAVVFAGTGRVELRDVPAPELLDPGDAVIRVEATGICGSDLHFFNGKAPLEDGDVMGHEAVGIVEEVGPDVRRFGTGDRVAVSFAIACGSCWFCRRGQTQLCEQSRILGAGAFGGSLPGTQAERVRVPVADVNLLALPVEIDDEAGVFVGDVLATATGAAAIADPANGEVVAVVGCGPVGVLVVQSLRLRGAERILAFDRVSGRLDLAAAAGAEPVDVRARNPHMAAAAATGDRGVDVGIECVGHPDAFETALDVVRRGGRVVVAGMYAGETIDAQLGAWWARALDLRFMGPCPVHAWWERALGNLVDGAVDPRPLVSHRFRLDDAGRGYEAFDAHEATKVVLRP